MKRDAIADRCYRCKRRFRPLGDRDRRFELYRQCCERLVSMRTVLPDIIISAARHIMVCSEGHKSGLPDRRTFGSTFLWPFMESVYVYTGQDCGLRRGHLV